MKDTERHAINNLNNLLQNRRDNFTNQIKNNVQILVQGFNELDQNFKQKEQLLVQKERELDRLKSITDNSSKVARNIVNESKDNLDKATELLNSGNFNEALKYSDRALYNLEDIDNLGLQTIAQANNLYLERKQQYVEAVAKRDDFYKQGVINGVNAFSWVKDNPTRDFYTFFRENLKVSDKSPENVNLINNRLYHNLPKYLQEAQRANYFYNEYNKYHDVLLKLQQVINIYNIKAASSKGLKDYEDALKSCEVALEIEPTSTTLVNLKNAILQEKQVIEANKLEENNLLVSQTQEIENLKELLSIKEIETQEKNKLLTQKGNELVSTEKSLIEKHQKETEALKSLLAKKELEHQELLARKELEKKELIVQKEKEKKELLSLKEKQVKELENTKKLQEENIKKEQLLSNQNKLLSDKEQEIAKFKELFNIKEIETEELLAQKEKEIHNKSLVKNQVINELQDNIGLKEKEALNLKIELLMKQLAFKEKEVELKDKALEDALEIGKQKDIVNELQGKLLAFKNLSKHDETLQLELSLIHFKVEESILGGNVEEMKELSKYLSELMKNPIEKEESLDISELLNNLSPVNVQENLVQNPIAVINNFDINNVHTTHSVLISGEESSFDII